MIYPDSSYIAALLVPGDTWHEEACGYYDVFLTETPLHFTPWHFLEVRHAIRTKESKSFTSYHIRAVLRRLEAWMDLGRLVHQEFNWTTVKDKADLLSHKYAVKCLAGVVDYWHIGAATYFHSERFLTFDQTQRRLALLAGFDCPDLITSRLLKNG